MMTTVKTLGSIGESYILCMELFQNGLITRRLSKTACASSMTIYDNIAQPETYLDKDFFYLLLPCTELG